MIKQWRLRFCTGRALNSPITSLSARKLRLERCKLHERAPTRKRKGEGKKGGETQLKRRSFESIESPFGRFQRSVVVENSIFLLFAPSTFVSRHTLQFSRVSKQREREAERKKERGGREKKGKKWRKWKECAYYLAGSENTREHRFRITVTRGWNNWKASLEQQTAVSSAN